jgi:predicted enzyme related to lactoylglutathione lyase
VSIDVCTSVIITKNRPNKVPSQSSPSRFAIGGVLQQLAIASLQGLQIVGIICVERVLVAVRDLAASRENWRRAGFAVAPDDRELAADGIGIARMAAGAVEVDLCAMQSAGSVSPLAQHLREATTSDGGGGIIGWVWGVKGVLISDEREPRAAPSESILLPALSPPFIRAEMLSSGLPGVVTAAAPISLDIESRRQALARLCGTNANTVDYLEHIVVMTPVLSDAIAANEAVGVPCKRIREVGNGARQAFFKLEQTVLEIVGPATRGRPGCWGLALMCTDIAQAVATARANGLQATEPKLAIQGGQIARIVDPLDGVAIAFMQPGPRRDD